MQDENRHGDFFAAVLKARPECLNDWKAKLWSRFFCHSVYITMYLNDHMRSSFYEAIGLNTTQFDQHVIIETNNATARTFPAVRLPFPDGQTPTSFCYLTLLLFPLLSGYFLCSLALLHIKSLGSWWARTMGP
jgi:magnesium-protoporphyrin IX monomethyl ester (oxidative) cyclase